MKRFIDLRESNISGGKFAFYCTVKDVFEFFTDHQTQVWETWDEFKMDYISSGHNDLQRYEKICPDWVLNYGIKTWMI